MRVGKIGVVSEHYGRSDTGHKALCPVSQRIMRSASTIVVVPTAQPMPPNKQNVVLVSLRA